MAPVAQSYSQIQEFLIQFHGFVPPALIADRQAQPAHAFHDEGGILSRPSHGDTFEERHFRLFTFPAEIGESPFHYQQVRHQSGVICSPGKGQFSFQKGNGGLAFPSSPQGVDLGGNRWEFSGQSGNCREKKNRGG